MLVADQTISLASITAAEFAELAARRDELAQALADADIVPQLLVHAQLSGDDTLLAEAAPFISGGWSYMQRIPPELCRRISRNLAATIDAYARGGRAWDGHIPCERLKSLMSVGIGRDIPDEYVPMMLEELARGGRDPRSVDFPPVSERVLQDYTVAIVGAGMSGICMAIKLKEVGIPFVIYEKNSAVGGTWFENSYPGAGVDVPSHYYSFSFEPKPDWSHHFAKRDELWAYLRHCAEKYGIMADIRFGTEVKRAAYDEAAGCWRLDTDGPDGAGTETATFFICAVGQLNRPKIPAIDGMERFAGPVFHTAEWDHAQDLSGKRVALVGTGASSMQVGPAIVDSVERLLIFQRSPCWVARNPNYLLPVSEGMKWAMAHVPFYAKWHRYLLSWATGDVLHASLQVDPDWASPGVSLNAENEKMRQALMAHIKSELRDRPDLIEKVTPSYPPYGKRMLRDNNWYQLLKRANVELVNAEVASISAGEIVDSNGVAHPVDAIVLATGFQANRILWPMEIVGRNGHSIRESWGRDDPRAYLGMTVPAFPNMFILFGPNTNLSHGGSLFFHAECQVRHVMLCLRQIIEGNFAEIECRSDVFRHYNECVDDAHSRMVWSHPAMNSWYKNSSGRVVANSPWRLVDYWAMTKNFDANDYVFARGAVTEGPVRSVSR